ncbi:MAG: hypothetical protein WD960_10905 [Gemmatimonadota bacterium]
MRMVLEHAEEYSSQWAAIESIRRLRTSRELRRRQIAKRHVRPLQIVVLPELARATMASRRSAPVPYVTERRAAIPGE